MNVGPRQRTLHLEDRRSPRPGRPDGATDDIHFTDDLVAHFIEAHSRRGDIVLDPFAGFGTTVFVAERMGRRGIAIETLAARAEAIRLLAPTAIVVHGDARHIGGLVDRGVHLVVTSPPYMTSILHPHNPLTGYETLDGDYACYLDELADVFAGVAQLLTADGRVVVNVADVRIGDHVTPLVADVGAAAGRSLDLVEDVTLRWDEDSRFFASEHCLVFEPIRDSA